MTRPYASLLAARCNKPHSILGLRRENAEWLLRAFYPDAASLTIEWLSAAEDGGLVVASREMMQLVDDSGLFEWRGQLPVFTGLAGRPAGRYSLLLESKGQAGRSQRIFYPYAYPPQPPADDLFLFSEGRFGQSYRLLGAEHEIRHDVPQLSGTENEAAACTEDEPTSWVHGVRFRVWAPQAERVSVVGEFNGWDGRVHPMQWLGDCGVWELFIPGLAAGTVYKYELLNAQGEIVRRSDPYARQFDKSAEFASCVADESQHVWQDGAWLGRRAIRDWVHAPLSIYEVHPGTWRRHADGRCLTYRELANQLIPYVLDLGYTHIEFMPLMDHPADESREYQCSGHFAVHGRYGTADELRYLIDACHRAGLGVIFDWTPGHFPEDERVLAHFDGASLYEQASADGQGLNAHFDFSRPEVQSFLLSSARYWLDEFHVDGLRIDAMASMLSAHTTDRACCPDVEMFFRNLNTLIQREFPGVLTIAEGWCAENSAVSRLAAPGSLGFSLHWDETWMRQTLRYLLTPAADRGAARTALAVAHAVAEEIDARRFVLPLSHDVITVEERSLLQALPGSLEQAHANLRLLLACQMCFPGKKLSFMGMEMAQAEPWNGRQVLDWTQLEQPLHAGTFRMVRDLHRLYRQHPALFELDFVAAGMDWIGSQEGSQRVVCWRRQARNGQTLVVVANFMDQPRFGLRIGLPENGRWQEVFNSDSQDYCGTSTVLVGFEADIDPWLNQPASVKLDLPALSLRVFEPTS